MKTQHNPVYILLTEAAKASVANTGKFLKHDVIVNAGLGAFEDKLWAHIQWPVVRDAVEVEAGSMTPIAVDNDDPEADRDPDIHPEAFLPGGRRRTIGYALANVMPRVSMEHLRRRYNSAMGTMKSMDRLAVSLQAQGLSISYKPADRLPVLELPAAAAE